MKWDRVGRRSLRRRFRPLARPPARPPPPACLPACLPAYSTATSAVFRQVIPAHGPNPRNPERQSPSRRQGCAENRRATARRRRRRRRRPFRHCRRSSVAATSHAKFHRRRLRARDNECERARRVASANFRLRLLARPPPPPPPPPVLSNREMSARICRHWPE